MRCGCSSPRPRSTPSGRLGWGCRGAAIGFVSSNCRDVIGAKAYGFQVIWVNRPGAPLEELGLAPDLEVRDLTGLAQALGR